MSETVKRKLSSRKLWMAIAGLVSMIMIYRGADEGTAESVASIIMGAGLVMSYIIAEGWTDATTTNSQYVEDKEN